MEKRLIIKKIQFYCWVGLGYLFIWLLNALAKYPEVFVLRALNEVWRIIFLTAACFLFFEWYLPKGKLTALKVIPRILLFPPLTYALGFLLFVWRFIGIHLKVYTVFTTYDSLSAQIGEYASSVVMSFLFFGIIKHIYDHVKLKQAAQQLRIEKQEAELNYLKSQTNPHFLFNTLNNIYSLARDKSDLAPESILRLSKILRYMLYEAGGNYIAIEQELKIISDYIALEQLRYDDSLQVNLVHDIEDMRQALPPLLLIPLVENAFKHGVSETRGQPFVNIHLSVSKRQLQFIVKNSTEAYIEDKEVKENIGLSNLRRQLQLLYTDHALTVQQDNAQFTATLKINLASHV